MTPLFILHSLSRLCFFGRKPHFLTKGVLTIRITLRLPDDLYNDTAALAKDTGSSVNSVIEQAVKCYRDKRYMEDKATIINEEILKIIQADHALLLQQINNKTNRVISELAIQNAIQNLILASELDVDAIRLDNYRKQAVEFLKTNNRVFRLDEIAE